jgi:hypothetical protein
MVNGCSSMNHAARRALHDDSAKGGVPLPSVDGSRAARLLPFVLSIIAGNVDIIGFLGLGGLFTAHVTGNLVVLAAKLVAGDQASLAHLIAVPTANAPVFSGTLQGQARRTAGVPAAIALQRSRSLALFRYRGSDRRRGRTSYHAPRARRRARLRCQATRAVFAGRGEAAAWRDFAHAGALRLRLQIRP